MHIPREIYNPREMFGGHISLQGYMSAIYPSVVTFQFKIKWHKKLNYRPKLSTLNGGLSHRTAQCKSYEPIMHLKMQACFIRPGPPYLSMSAQLAHLSQLGRRHCSHPPQRLSLALPPPPFDDTPLDTKLRSRDGVHVLSPSSSSLLGLLFMLLPTEINICLKNEKLSSLR